MEQYRTNDLFTSEGEDDGDKQSGRQTGRITGRQLAEMFERQGRRCALSGVELKRPNQCAADHITPVSAGGENAMENIQILHKIVNHMKGTLSQEEFIHWCTLIADANRTHIEAVGVWDGGVCAETF